MKARSDDEKAAVIAALLDGQSVSAAAREFNIPRQTVQVWKKQMPNDSAPKKEIGELIMELMRARLITLKAITDAIDNPDYLKRQPGSDLAVLYGVMDDKLVRQLEFLSKGNNDTSADHAA
jgi:hypothetical protein